MRTRIINIGDFDTLIIAKSFIKHGGVIAVPTDTVYGIVCEIEDEKAIDRIYKIKIREKTKSLPVLIGSLDQLDLIAKSISLSMKKLMDCFWPGALTLITDKKDSLPANLTNSSTIGVRMPDHDWLRNFMMGVGPLAATSANISDMPSPVSSQEVLNQLKGRIPLIIDGGICEGGLPSTIIDCTSKPVKVLREGGIPTRKIMDALYS